MFKGFVAAICFCFFHCLFVFCFVLFFENISLCSPGCPGTHSVDKAGLNLSAYLCLPSAEIKGAYQGYLAVMFLNALRVKVF